VPKELDPGSAMDTANFRLNAGLVVSNAVLAPGGTNIILTTSPQTPGVEYALFIENVRDVSMNQVPIGSRLAFWGWAPIRVSIRGTGTNSVISWFPPTGTLEISEAIAGPWVTLPAATSPYPIFVPAQTRFYRVAAPP
jgi:hypothetical protein